MKMKMVDPSEYLRLQERYGGRYIAKLKGRVLFSARTNAALMKKIHIVYRTKPLVISYVRPKGAVYV